MLYNLIYNILNNMLYTYVYNICIYNVLYRLGQERAGGGPPGLPAAACGKPACDTSCHHPPPGREPGPCGAQTPAEWGCWWGEFLFWRTGRRRFWLGCGLDCQGCATAPGAGPGHVTWSRPCLGGVPDLSFPALYTVSSAPCSKSVWAGSQSSLT